MFCDESQYLWSILLHQMEGLYAGRILGELDKALGSLPRFFCSVYLHIGLVCRQAKQARKAPKLTGKLLLVGRSKTQ